jgi:hypothetical protein
MHIDTRPCDKCGATIIEGANLCLDCKKKKLFGAEFDTSPSLSLNRALIVALNKAINKINAGIMTVNLKNLTRTSQERFSIGQVIEFLHFKVDMIVDIENTTDVEREMLKFFEQFESGKIPEVEYSEIENPNISIIGGTPFLTKSEAEPLLAVNNYWSNNDKSSLEPYFTGMKSKRLDKIEYNFENWEMILDFYNRITGDGFLSVLKGLGARPHSKSQKLVGKKILFLGLNPYSDDEYAEFVNDIGILNSFDDCYFNHEIACQIIIIGEEVDTDILCESILVANNNGIEHLKIYTQELFLLEFIHGIDVWNEQDLLSRIEKKYSVLTKILLPDEYPFSFDWKTFKISNGNGEGMGGDLPFLPHISPLRSLGYDPSASSPLSQSERREILQDCLQIQSSNLPQCESESYMQQWGEANTCKRLIRTARQVAYCPANTGPQTEQRKQSDLDYLKKNFFTGLCSSSNHWPKISKYL